MHITEIHLASYITRYKYYYAKAVKMILKKTMIMIVIILTILSTGKVCTFAMDTGFKTDNIELEEQQTF